MDTELWWRIDWLPSAEEWQAVWAAASVLVAGISLLVTVGGVLAAAVALWFAKKQVDEVVQSNEALRDSNLELARPRIIVDFRLKRKEMYDARDSFIGFLDLVISNGGRGPARDIRLFISPLPTAYTMPPLLKQILTGQSPIPTLMPAADLRYELERFKQGKKFDPIDLLHHVYAVRVTYTDSSGVHTFSETYPLSIAPLLFAKISPSGLDRIEKDLQNIGLRIADLQRPQAADSDPSGN